MKTIAVIEDDQDVREGIGALLEFDGMRVLAFANGQDALRGLRDEAPDLILLDLVMPVLSGEEFLEECAREGLFQSVPIVLITSFSRQRAPTARACNRRLEKPFDVVEFLRMVHEFVGARP